MGYCPRQSFHELQTSDAVNGLQQMGEVFRCQHDDPDCDAARGPRRGVVSSREEAYSSGDGSVYSGDSSGAAYRWD